MLPKVKKKQNHGYALLIVLIFLLIFSFIGIESLIYTAQMIKLTHAQIKGQEDKQKAERLLNQVETRLIYFSSSCNIERLPAFVLAKKSLSWWQQYGCHDQYQGTDYYYVVEFLEKDACAIVKANKAGDKSIALYQRVTLCLVPKQSIVEKIILQSTLVKAVDENNPSCHNQFRFIQSGRQILRELT